MKITNYQVNANNAFIASGRNRLFIAAPYDYSFIGVAINNGFTKVVTAAGPQHIVAAAHYGLNIGDKVQFFNKSGLTRTATVSSTQSFGDVQVCKTKETFESLDVSIAKIARYDKAQIKGKTTLVFGLENTTKSVIAAYNSASALQLSSYGIMLTQSQTKGVSIDFGDSGAPDFIVNGPDLELVGPHWSVSPTTFYTSYLSDLVSNLI